MGRDFYTLAKENVNTNPSSNAFQLDEDGNVPYAARIAVYDDPSMTPRVVIIDPSDIHSFLAEITNTVTKLAREQGGSIPFIVIREICENFIHALFIEPTISILDNGNTIRFADQGPGIQEKELALEFGTSSATPEMKQYIRGVGSGLPNAMQYMLDKGGSLTVQDNISSGTVVTISTSKNPSASKPLPPKEDAYSYSKEQNPTNNNQSRISLTEREIQVLTYLQTNPNVGPSDLVKTHSGSNPTWSRILKELDMKGFLQKDGQKRVLTTIGKQYLQDLKI